MASVNIAKYTTGATRGLAVHFDDNKRKEHEHTNIHIQKEMTDQNYWIGADNYNEVLYKLGERQRELDKQIPPKRIRSDRVTCLTAEIPVPKAIEKQGLADDFLNNAYKVLELNFGADNVHGMTVHKDEIHDYIEPITKEKKTSLIHAHAFITPEADDKGLNAKHCLTRQRLIDLQKSMNEMCLERYGMEFQTHELARQLSVEQLKNESLQTEREILTNDKQMLENGNNHIVDEIVENNDTIDRQRELLARTKDDIKDAKIELKELKSEIEDKNNQLDELIHRYQDIQADLKKIEQIRAHRREQIQKREEYYKRIGYEPDNGDLESWAEDASERFGRLMQWEENKLRQLDKTYEQMSKMSLNIDKTIERQKQVVEDIKAYKKNKKTYTTKLNTLKKEIADNQNVLSEQKGFFNALKDALRTITRTSDKILDDTTNRLATPEKMKSFKDLAGCLDQNLDFARKNTRTLELKPLEERVKIAKEIAERTHSIKQKTTKVKDDFGLER